MVPGQHGGIGKRDCGGFTQKGVQGSGDERTRAITGSGRTKLSSDSWASGQADWQGKPETVRLVPISDTQQESEQVQRQAAEKLPW